VRRRNLHRARPPPFLFPSARGSQLRQLIAAFKFPAISPSPLLSLLTQCSPATYGKAAGRRILPLPLPLSLRFYLKPSSSPRSPLCTCNTPTHAPEAPRTHNATALVRRSAARPAAVVELHHRRLPFARELARIFFTW
jgi:hypothetical protein